MIFDIGTLIHRSHSITSLYPRHDSGKSFKMELSNLFLYYKLTKLLTNNAFLKDVEVGTNGRLYCADNCIFKICTRLVID